MSHASAAVWHYIDASGQKGPVSAEQMAALARAGTVRPETMVWSAGMAGWAPFAQSPLARGMPPPTVQPGGSAGSYDPATFGGAVRTCFGKYATFAGRARRPEFWYFALFNFLVGTAASIADSVLFGMDGASPLNGLYSLAVLAPSLAVGARRLHDTDRSGWWQLLFLVPVLGWIVLIVFWCQRGTEGPNRFG
jgi:uncharacterized membrane protein YhaH (DUF805 family)